MSYTHFHHWGARIKTDIERLIDGTDYGVAYTQANDLLQDGQIVIDKTLEGTMAWTNNPATDGSGNHYKGCFMGPEFSQYTCGTSEFANKWFGPATGTLKIGIGQTNASSAEKMIGVSYNTLWDANNDYVQLKVCGIASLDYNDATSSTTGYYIQEGDSVGKCGNSGATPSSNNFAWVANNVNQVEEGGSVYIKINATETL